MTDPAPTNIDPALDPFIARAGQFALELGCRPSRRFDVHTGGRRMLGEKTPRPAVNLIPIQGGKQPVQSSDRN
jgi:hypothetical protein